MKGIERVSLPPEAVPVVSALMHMWSELGTPEEVLEMILSYSYENLDLEVIETPHGTLRLLRPPLLRAKNDT